MSRPRITPAPDLVLADAMESEAAGIGLAPPHIKGAQLDRWYAEWQRLRALRLAVAR